jgi:CrcB protein
MRATSSEDGTQAGSSARAFPGLRISALSQSPSPTSLIIAVAAGSAVGGVARFLLSQAAQERWETSFPVGTLLVNLLGCFALGFIAQLAAESSEFSPTTRALLTVGFCGGFTTFSTFANETMLAAEAGAYRRAALYVGSSVFAGLAGIWLGAMTARVLLAILRRSA